MIRKAMIAALAACSFSAHGQEIQTWNFVWAGPFAHDFEGAVWNESVEGSFSAIDANNDKIITRNEVTKLSVDGHSITSCSSGNCELSDFLYSGGNALTFDARTWWRYDYEDDWFYGSDAWYVADGEIDSSNCWNMNCDYFWANAQPGVTMTVTAVPEPATYAMLSVGLMGVGFACKRRKP